MPGLQELLALSGLGGQGRLPLYPSVSEEQRRAAQANAMLLSGLDLLGGAGSQGVGAIGPALTRGLGAFQGQLAEAEERAFRGRQESRTDERLGREREQHTLSMQAGELGLDIDRLRKEGLELERALNLQNREAADALFNQLGEKYGDDPMLLFGRMAAQQGDHAGIAAAYYGLVQRDIQEQFGPEIGQAVASGNARSLEEIISRSQMRPEQAKVLRDALVDYSNARAYMATALRPPSTDPYRGFPTVGQMSDDLQAVAGPIASFLRKQVEERFELGNIARDPELSKRKGETTEAWNARVSQAREQALAAVQDQAEQEALRVIRQRQETLSGLDPRRGGGGGGGAASAAEEAQTLKGKNYPRPEAHKLMSEALSPDGSRAFSAQEIGSALDAIYGAEAPSAPQKTPAPAEAFSEGPPRSPGANALPRPESEKPAAPAAESPETITQRGRLAQAGLRPENFEELLARSPGLKKMSLEDLLELLRLFQSGFGAGESFRPGE